MTRARSRFIASAACATAVAAGVALAAAQKSPEPAPRGLPSRTTSAVTYEARRTTKIDLVGTPLLPRTRGEAEIKTEAAGPVRITARVRDVTPATQFGPEYLTFVLWAIPPEGRPKNLGEIRPDDGDAEIEATTNVQTFALIVTAEPYYAVTTPGDVVVMENAVRATTRGTSAAATLRHEIVPRGAYVAAAGGGYVAPSATKREPPDVQQARNALAIAQLAAAGQYAQPALANAQRLLADTEQLVASKESKREIISQARAAVQAAEEARLQAVRGRVAAEAEAERAEAAAREQAARDQAAQQAAARRAADEERQRAEVERQRAEQAAQQAADLAAQAGVERQRADEARREAEHLAQQAADEKRQADAAREDAERARSDAQAEAARAEGLRAKAEEEKSALRASLLKQFNDILDTRDTARGLIVNVGDVLFETGRYELRPPAREKLARFAGLVLAHPGLVVQAEGFTDSTGTDAINQRLSQQRADAVGSYLLAQGLAADRVTARGYGPEHPVASNDTREGRQQNRRVELVVAGDVIGTPLRDSRR